MTVPANSKLQIQVFKRKWIVMALTCLMVGIGSSVAQTEDRIAQMQRTIDAADDRIRDIVRSLAAPGLSTATITRLNREMKDQEWAKSQAQAVIVRERDRDRKRQVAEAETSRLVQAVSAFVAQGEYLRTDINNLKAEGREYEAAVRNFNSGTQTQAEYNRLETWRLNLLFRQEQINKSITKHEGRRRELQNWETRIKALFAQS